MPRYRILQGKLWHNKCILTKGDEVFLKEKVAKAYGLGRLELLEEPEPKKEHVFVINPAPKIPEEIEPIPVEEEVKVPRPRKRRGRKPKNRK